MQRRALARAAGRIAAVLVCGLLPLLTLYYAIAPVAFGDQEAADFHFNYFYAAEAIRAGQDFYPAHGFIVRGPDDLIIDYVYPPLVALLTVPWTLLPVGLAESLFQFLLVALFVITLAILGVRDWRCYGLAFLWPPVLDTIATGNISILLGLCAAVVWRYRDRARVSGATLGVSIAAKIFLWPLTIWLAASRRAAAAVWSVGVAAALLFLSWAVVGFKGLVDYPDLVQRLGDRMDERGYTLYALGVDLGLAEEVAWALWAGLAVALLVTTVVLARRGDDRRAFIVGLAAAIGCSPIVWLHYFSLLLVVVAIATPRLAPIWFLGIPFQLVVTTGVYNGSTFQLVSVLLLAALTLALALVPPEVKLAPARAQLFGRARTVSSSPR
jgi:alpha-1,2-mannosyltransferase